MLKSRPLVSLVQGRPDPMTKDLAFELSSSRNHVNALAPGWVRTPLVEALARDENFNSLLRSGCRSGDGARPRTWSARASCSPPTRGSSLRGRCFWLTAASSQRW